MTSQKNSVQLDGLQPDARYVVQVRARTVAGYGQYSRPAEFETTSERGTPLGHCMPAPAPAHLSRAFTHRPSFTSRLRCPAASRAAPPYRGLHRSRVCLHGGCRGHRSRLPQVPQAMAAPQTERSPFTAATILGPGFPRLFQPTLSSSVLVPAPRDSSPYPESRDTTTSQGFPHANPCLLYSAPAGSSAMALTQSTRRSCSSTVSVTCHSVPRVQLL